MKKKTGKIEIIIIAAIAVISLIAIIILSNMPKGVFASVTYGNKEIMRISLSKDQIYEIDADLPVTLEVVDGHIHFIDSVCPDHLCEGFGLISLEHEYAICMPARIALQIKPNE